MNYYGSSGIVCWEQEQQYHKLIEFLVSQAVPQVQLLASCWMDGANLVVVTAAVLCLFCSIVCRDVSYFVDDLATYKPSVMNCHIRVKSTLHFYRFGHQSTLTFNCLIVLLRLVNFCRWQWVFYCHALWLVDKLWCVWKIYSVETSWNRFAWHIRPKFVVLNVVEVDWFICNKTSCPFTWSGWHLAPTWFELENAKLNAALHWPVPLFRTVRSQENSPLWLGFHIKYDFSKCWK